MSGNSDDNADWDAWFRPATPAVPAAQPPAVPAAQPSPPRRPPPADEAAPTAQFPSAFPPPPAAGQQRSDQPRYDQPPAGQQPFDRQPFNQPPFDRQPSDQQPFDEQDSQDPEQPQPRGRHGKRSDGKPGREKDGRKRRKLPYVLVAVAVVVAAGAGGAALLLPRGEHTQKTGFLPTGSTASQDAQQTARAFLRAWDTGHLQQAANYTDHPAAAKTALTAFQTYLHLSKLSSTQKSVTAISPSSASSASSSSSPGPATPHEKVTYAASARVSAPSGASAISGTWTYHASLVTYQDSQSSYWYVAWQPDDLAPNLTGTRHLAAVRIAPHVTSVADSRGGDLTSYGDPGLSNIAAGVEASAPPGIGSPGLAVEIQSRKGRPIARTRAVVIAPKNVSGLGTTIDPAAEQAALSAVRLHKDSSMVVLQPSSGKILAVANNAGFNDFALTARVAPGSTMKTITSTALFTEGVLTPETPVECPKKFTIQGITYHNDKGESEPPSTPFITDFAQSCNNAFSTQWEHLTGGRLARTARTYFGLDRKWDIGIASRRQSASYFNAPVSASGSELAQEAFGEGQLTASPLAMASIAATIDSGQFQQPYLTANAHRVTATPLPAQTDHWMKKLMRAVVTSGTAEPIGFGAGVYAKTGTADIKGQGQPNSWLIAFEPSRDIAVGCLVLNAGYGAQFAGPEVKAFLGSY